MVRTVWTCVSHETEQRSREEGPHTCKREESLLKHALLGQLKAFLFLVEIILYQNLEGWEHGRQKETKKVQATWWGYSLMILQLAVNVSELI